MNHNTQELVQKFHDIRERLIVDAQEIGMLLTSFMNNPQVSHYEVSHYLDVMKAATDMIVAIAKSKEASTAIAGSIYSKYDAPIVPYSTQASAQDKSYGS